MFFWNKKSKEKADTDFISKIDALKIKDQLESQIKILYKIGILKMLTDGKTLGVLGIDSKEYPVPNLQEILERLENKKELVENKIAQGFTKIIIVPLACPFEEIIKKYKELLIAHHADGKLLAIKENGVAEDKTLELDVEHPINVWNECMDGDIKNNFIYFPQIFKSENHQGKTKIELLSNPDNAWQIYFLEDLPNIPAVGKGKKINHRKQIETDKTPKEYLAMLQTNKMYLGEEGLPPEAELTYAIIHLEETNQIINDWQNKGTISCALGAFILSSSSVFRLSWNRDFNRADLWKFNIEEKDPYIGARVGVRI